MSLNRSTLKSLLWLCIMWYIVKVHYGCWGLFICHKPSLLLKDVWLYLEDSPDNHKLETLCLRIEEWLTKIILLQHFLINLNYNFLVCQFLWFLSGLWCLLWVGSLETLCSSASKTLTTASSSTLWTKVFLPLRHPVTWQSLVGALLDWLLQSF